MSSITIHDMDSRLYEKIKEMAINQGISINKAVKNLLEKSIGAALKDQHDRRDNFMDLFGTWTKEEAEEFSGNIRDFEVIDAMDWK